MGLWGCFLEGLAEGGRPSSKEGGLVHGSPDRKRSEGGKVHVCLFTFLLASTTDAVIPYGTGIQFLWPSNLDWRPASLQGFSTSSGLLRHPVSLAGQLPGSQPIWCVDGDCWNYSAWLMWANLITLCSIYPLCQFFTSRDPWLIQPPSSFQNFLINCRFWHSFPLNRHPVPFISSSSI